MVEGVSVDAESFVDDPLGGAVGTHRSGGQPGALQPEADLEHTRHQTRSVYLFPGRSRRVSGHMSSSGVESMMSWTSDHSSLLPMPGEDTAIRPAQLLWVWAGDAVLGPTGQQSAGQLTKSWAEATGLSGQAPPPAQGHLCPDRVSSCLSPDSSC